MLPRFSVMVLVVSSAVVASAQRQPGTFAYVHTSQQTLADGTHISRTTHSVTIRDGYGRTRNENESQIPGRPMVRSVSITDPIAGVSYFYQEGDGQAIPHTYNRMEMQKSAATALFPRMPSATGAVASSAGTVGLVSASSGNTIATGAVPVSVSAASQAMRADVKVEDVGFDTVQGVSCKSRRTTEVYPVNFFGNDRPITVTRENCMSTENGGMLVRNVSDDPRTGTQTMLLESASFTEPAETLFQPPAGYAENTQNRPR